MKNLTSFSKKMKKTTAFILSSITILMTFVLAAPSAGAAVVEENPSLSKPSDSAKIKSASGLPSKYSSVDLGYVTSVKKQSAKNCWVYGSLATVESFLLKNGIVFPELSTYHLDKWGTPDERGLGWQRTLGSGALHLLPMGYFVSRQGPFAKADDTSQESFAGININAIEYITMENPTRIKELIYQCGAVTANYNNGGMKYFNTDKTAFYCYDQNAEIEGHSVSVVGWDDDYPKENFTSCGATPNENGAWLVKNSWGDYNPLHGYFWISYEDLFIFSDVFSDSYAVLSAEKSSEFQKLYQNETYGATYGFDYLAEKQNVTYMNFYDFSDGYDRLNKVIFETESKGADYSVYYVPAEDENIVTDTSRWTLVSRGTVDYDGYICVDAGGFQLPLGYGAIAVTIDTQKVNEGVPFSDDNYVDNVIGVDEWLVKAGTKEYLFLNESGYNESFLMFDGKFYDMKDYYARELGDDIGATAVIKAEAENTSQEPPKATLAGDADLNGQVSIKDVTMVQMFLANLRKSSVIRDLNSDMDNDGSVTVNDAAAIQIKLAHL